MRGPAGLASAQDVLDFWIGSAADDSEALEVRDRLWFRKSEASDETIRAAFGQTLDVLAAGMALTWAERGPRDRLAAIISLDQFSRNIHRGTSQAFANDADALQLCKKGLMKGDDAGLKEIERIFFYLPLEHSERQADQALSVANFEKLAQSARPEFRAYADKTLSYAISHKSVIDQFGRFPHRNGILGRESTPEELDYLSRPGAGF
ncbi:MAG: DUF924 family protein [Pseudomonadota bacterium]